MLTVLLTLKVTYKCHSIALISCTSHQNIIHHIIVTQDTKPFPFRFLAQLIISISIILVMKTTLLMEKQYIPWMILMVIAHNGLNIGFLHCCHLSASRRTSSFGNGRMFTFCVFHIKIFSKRKYFII